MSSPPPYGPQYGYPPPPGSPYDQGYPPQQPQYHQQPTMVVATPPTTVIIQERRGVNHALHCIITFFFFPWIIVWIVLCLTQ